MIRALRLLVMYAKIRAAYRMVGVRARCAERGCPFPPSPLGCGVWCEDHARMADPIEERPLRLALSCGHLDVVLVRPEGDEHACPQGCGLVSYVADFDEALR